MRRAVLTVTMRRAPSLPQGALSTGNVARILAAMAPENCIVATDSGGGGAAYPVMQRAVRNSWLNLTGGAIGQGGPVATGAAIACPDRQVFALLGDGGAMYTIQCLWTQARESTKVVTVIFSNRAYNILEVEYRRLGINDIGKTAASLFDLSGAEHRLGRPRCEHGRARFARGHVRRVRAGAAARPRS